MTNPPNIPRTLVAEALGLSEDDLPPGDLPMARFAERVRQVLRDTAEADDPGAHPDAWTLALFFVLAEDHPALCLAALRAGLAACECPEDVAALAAGPLEALLTAHGPALLGDIETLAETAPRFRYALTGVWPPETGAGLFWARIRALTEGTAGLDDDAAMPGAEGLVPGGAS